MPVSPPWSWKSCSRVISLMDSAEVPPREGEGDLCWIGEVCRGFSDPWWSLEEQYQGASSQSELQSSLPEGMWPR